MPEQVRLDSVLFFSVLYLYSLQVWAKRRGPVIVLTSDIG